MIRWFTSAEILELADNEIAAWFQRASDPLPAWCLGEEVLSPTERDRAANIRHPRAKAEFIRGRVVVRSALPLFGLPSNSPIHLNPYGKPFVPEAGFHFNTSHTAGAALFAFARCELGVDLELPEPTRDLEGLIRRYFDASEQAEFFSMPVAERPAAFLRGWTCKEALVKARGTGVRDLEMFSVGLATPGIRRAPAGTWRLECGQWDNYSWAIAEKPSPEATA